MPRYLCALCALALAAVLSGCFTTTPPPPPGHPNPTGDLVTNSLLRIGDGVRIEISGIPTPTVPIDQEIKGDGSITLPYIGRVTAAGKTSVELEKELYTNYVPTIYIHASVTVTPLGRYFYVGGQVLMPGRYLYSGPITVMGAIQAAGDFNPFANRRNVQITRVDGAIAHVNCVKVIKTPSLDVAIYPGDRIFVNKRF